MVLNNDLVDNAIRLLFKLLISKYRPKILLGLRERDSFAEHCTWFNVPLMTDGPSQTNQFAISMEMDLTWANGIRLSKCANSSHFVLNL